MPQTDTPPDFAALLATATTDPARSAQPTVLPQLLSRQSDPGDDLQCHARGISLGPLASLNRWNELGRYVRKGVLVISIPVEFREQK